METSTTQPTSPQRLAKQKESRWKSLAWFCVPFLLVAGGFEVGARRVGPNTTQIPIVLESHREELESRGTEVEWLFIGDSSTGADVNPTRFAEAAGIGSAYNLWSPTASLSNIEPLVADFGLRDGLEPDAVVLGVTGRMFNETVQADRLATQDQIERSLPWRSRADPTFLTGVEQRFADRLALVRYRAQLRKPLAWVNGWSSRSEIPQNPDGQATLFSDRTVDDLPSGYEAGERKALIGYSVSEEDLLALDRTITALDQAGIRVIVLNLPTNNGLFDDYYPNGTADVEAFNTALEDRLATLPAEYVDLRSLGLDPSLFADGNHMNSDGSDALTDAFVGAIAP